MTMLSPSRPPSAPPSGPSAPAPSWREMLGGGLLSYRLVVLATLALVTLGLAMVLSASMVTSYLATGSVMSIFLHQLTWVALGAPVFVAASRVRLEWVRRWATLPLMAATMVGLLAVLVPGIGSGAYGATRWIALGPLTLQPSELAKLALALWGADVLARKERLLDQRKHLFVPLLPAGLICAALVLVEPDMGTAVVLTLICLGLLWFAGVSVRTFAAVLGAAGVLAGLLAVASPYRLARLTSFTHPFAHAHGTGYQAVEGLYALASGGWWGVGLGASRAQWRFLPNAHTDFIFAVIGEQLGVVGTLTVLLLFGVLGYCGMRIALRSTDLFSRLAAGAITVWLIGQAVINVSAVVGLLPITGIPLPLVSFGGSALLPTLAALGLLAGLARREPAAAQVLAELSWARKQRRWARGARAGRATRTGVLAPRQSNATRRTSTPTRREPVARRAPGSRSAPPPRRRASPR